MPISLDGASLVDSTEGEAEAEVETVLVAVNNSDAEGVYATYVEVETLGLGSSENVVT